MDTCNIIATQPYTCNALLLNIYLIISAIWRIESKVFIVSIVSLDMDNCNNKLIFLLYLPGIVNLILISWNVASVKYKAGKGYWIERFYVCSVLSIEISFILSRFYFILTWRCMYPVYLYYLYWLFRAAKMAQKRGFNDALIAHCRGELSNFLRI